MDISKDELKEAKRQIDSVLHKLRETIKTFEAKESAERYKSQITLAKRRVKSFEIANWFIENELNKNQYLYNCNPMRAHENTHGCGAVLPGNHWGQITIPLAAMYLMGHSDIGVTLNTYTHLGLEDAADELKRMEELADARKGLEKAKEEKPVSQKMFRAI